MYTVVQQAIRRLTVISTLFVTLIISSVARAHQTCGQEELVRCAQPLQVLTDSGLTFVASKKDLEVLCPDLREGLRCVHSYTRRCMSQLQRNHFHKLFHGTNNMVKQLCSNETYQNEYLKYAPCMREVVHEYELCFKQYQATMQSLEHPQTTQRPLNRTASTSDVDPQDNTIRSICCSFQEYVDCSTHTMRRACGEEAALFSKGFLDKMASSMNTMHCKEFSEGAAKCAYASASQFSISFLTVISLSLLSLLGSIVR